MELVVEHRGRLFDLNHDKGRREFDEYVESLPTCEEQYAVNGKALAAVDASLRALGFYCGLPIYNADRMSRDLYGYLPRFGNEKPSEVAQTLPRKVNHWRFKNKEGRRGVVTVYEGTDGKRFHRVDYQHEDWEFRFDRHVISPVHRLGSNPFQAELKAQEKLRTLISEYQYSSYILSGSFIVIARSGVWYVLRRGLPTIAFRYHDGEADILAALCIHPMGGRKNSFAGVMVPTDDIITTVLLIKADEHGLWKRANHIHIEDPQSGL